MTSLLEYIWIDAFGKPRSKTKIIFGNVVTINDCPEWSFDGSSTGQADGTYSDVILKPVAMYKDPFRRNKVAYLVLCETYDSNGIPLPSNNRNACVNISKSTKNFDPLFGVEQEYVLYENSDAIWFNKPHGWLNVNDPGIGPQGPYYCGVGGDKIFGRQIAEEHLDACLYAELKICGINAEVMPSQWEFQLGPLDPLSVCDQLWIARYILDRITEKYKCWVNYDPKPKDDWNGSGCHTNFSTKDMRFDNGFDKIIAACEKLAKKHNEHIIIYGKGNEKRLTGKFETSSYNKFTYGISNRGASVRIPLAVAKDKKGYLEDRRPASNADPYLVIKKILETVCLT